MNEKKHGPFCHIFCDEEDWFAYDVNTNALLEIEPVLAAVLPLAGRRDQEAAVKQVADRFGRDQVEEAMASLAEGRRVDGLFSDHRPRIVPPDPALAAAGACDRELSQLVLSVTDRCNLRCGYCPHGAGLSHVRSHGNATMTTGTAIGAVSYFLDRCADRANPSISFYGGEALLEAELMEEVVAFARRHSRGPEITFSIDTNGLLLAESLIGWLRREEIYLQISLDGPPDLHDRNRRTAGGGRTCERILENVERLVRADRSAADRLSFIVTLTPPTDLVAISDFYADFPPFRRVGIERQPVVSVNYANLQGLSWPASGEDCEDLQRQIESARREYLSAIRENRREGLGPLIQALFEPDLIRLHHRNRSPLGETFTTGANCRPGRRKLHVTVDGQYQPCERVGDVLSLGSVSTGIRPDDVGRLQLDFHQAVSERCRDCWALRLCRVCYSAQATERAAVGSGLPVPAATCRGVRRRVETDLCMMARVLQQPKSSRAFLDDTVVI